MVVRIKNLRLRAVIGVNEWERHHRQELIVNVEMEFDGDKASATDSINDTVDYDALEQRLAAKVEATEFFLLEKLAGFMLNIVLEDPRIIRATVEVDKPHALRFADSVSLSASGQR
jgi:D-erythro-7,8-dihydroneopterin triphosphate epimerase